MVAVDKIYSVIMYSDQAFEFGIQDTDSEEEWTSVSVTGTIGLFKIKW